MLTDLPRSNWNETYPHPKEKELKMQTARSVSYLVVISVRGLRNTNLKRILETELYWLALSDLNCSP